MIIKQRLINRPIIIFLGTILSLAIISKVHIATGPSLIPLDECPSERISVPSDLLQAIDWLDQNTSKKTKEKILYYWNKDVELDQYELMLSEDYGYVGFGAGIRNRWMLWNDTRLKRWFEWRGIRHPDLISKVIMDEFVNHLKGESVNNLLLNRIVVLVFVSIALTAVFNIFLWAGSWRCKKKNDRTGPTN